MKKLILLNFIVALFFNLKAQNCSNEKSVPEEMYRGRFKEEGMDYGNPYTMFNRKIDGWRLDSTLSKIQNLIINGVNAKGIANTEYSTMYREIYKFDTTNSEPVTCDDKSSTAHPKWTKDQALVYLIGLRYARINGRDTFIRMNDYDRNQFGARAHRGLSNLNPEVISCWGGDDCGKVHLKAFDLIQYLQAYDLLKTRGYILPYDQDRNGLDCSPRSKLREFSRNLYIQSNNIINSFTGWKKNHGIICASALLMAAQVLNDAGVETNYFNGILGWLWGDGFVLPHPRYNPVKTII